MRRSKLEIYIDLLKILRRTGPLNQTLLMYEVNACFKYVGQYLDFLMKYQLVEKKTFGKKRAKYTITEKGTSLLRTYRELEKALLINEPDA